MGASSAREIKNSTWYAGNRLPTPDRLGQGIAGVWGALRLVLHAAGGGGVRVRDLASCALASGVLSVCVVRLPWYSGGD